MRISDWSSDVCSSDLAPVLFQRENGVARLTLNRPDAGNTIDLPLARALMDAAIACDEDDAIRVVVLTGAGKMVCAGGDIDGFAVAGEDTGILFKQLTAPVHSAASKLKCMEKPLVTAIKGTVVDEVLSIALMGDVVIGDQSSIEEREGTEVVRRIKCQW